MEASGYISNPLIVVFGIDHFSKFDKKIGGYEINDRLWETISKYVPGAKYDSPQCPIDESFRNSGYYLVHISKERVFKHIQKLGKNLSDDIDLEGKILDSFVSLVLSYFDITGDVFSMLSSAVYSAIVIVGRKGQRTNLIGGLLYHYNPTIGCLVPFIAIGNSYHKKKIGTFLFMFLQRFHFYLFRDLRVLVWLSLTGKHATLDAGLVTFYRKLCFHPTLAYNYSLAYVLPVGVRKSLEAAINPEKKKRQFLMEVTTTITVMNRNLYVEFNNRTAKLTIDTKTDAMVSGKMQLSTPFMVAKLTPENKTENVGDPFDMENSFVRRTFSCQICGMPYSCDEKDGMKFVFCNAKINSSVIMLKSQPKKKNTNFQPICGVCICNTCQNNFGLTSRSNKCPIHIGALTKTEQKKFDPFDDTCIHTKINFDYLTNLIKPKKKTQELQDLRNSYFRQNFYIENANEDEVACLHCKIRHNLLHRGFPKDAYKQFCRGILNPEQICQVIRRRRDIVNFDEMRKINSKSKEICKAFDEISWYHHTPFFDGNCGKPSSVLLNRFLGLKNVDAHGDCGFIAIYLCLISTKSDVFFKKIQQNFITFIKNTLEFCQKRYGRRVFPYDGKVLDIRMIRLAFFCAIFDSIFKKELEEKKRMKNTEKNLEIETNANNDLSVKLQMAFGIPFGNIESDEQQIIFNNINTICSFTPTHRSQLSSNRALDHKYIQAFDFLKNEYMKTTMSDGSDVLWLDSSQLVELSRITYNEIGVLMVTDGDNDYYNNHESCSITDSGYYQVNKKHLFRECDNFIILRNLNSMHFDFFYDSLHKTAVFPTKQTRKRNPPSDKYNYVVIKDIISQLLSDNSYFEITGDYRTSIQDSTKELCKSIINKEENISIIERKFDTVNFATFESMLEKNNLEEFSKQESLFKLSSELTSWFPIIDDEREKILSFQNTKAGVKEFLTSSTPTIPDYFPIIINPELFDSFDTILRSTMFLKKNKDNPGNSSHTFSIFDCNKIQITEYHYRSFHHANSSIAMRNKKKSVNVFCPSSYCNNLTQSDLEFLWTCGFWKLADSNDFYDYLKKIMFLILVQRIKCSGNLYNKIHDMFRLQDFKNESLIYELSKIVLRASTDQKEKVFLKN